MPQPSPRMLGAQLWLNLPAADKMTAPRYGDIRHSSIPVINEDCADIRIIAGRYLEQSGGFEGSFVKATYLDVDVKPGCSWQYDSDPDATLFIYILRGAGVFDPDSAPIPEKCAVLFTQGRRFRVQASDSGIRFLLLTAKPLREPIAWGGPIVMNTEAELEKAFSELNNGTFIKTKN